MAAKSKFQKGEIQTLKRSQLKGAEYNPRIIDTEAKKRLKKLSITFLRMAIWLSLEDVTVELL